jgi:N-acetylglutamate synthase-like GNAT family acetyltransferase
MVEISFDLRRPESDSDWEAYYQCRWELLREPWDQPKGSEKDEYDVDAYHVMVVDHENEKNVLGVGRVHFNTPTEAQVRYMAVKEELREHGIGSLILTNLEQYAIDQGAEKIMLFARENAIDFYLRRGYFSQGPAHNLYGQIPHLHMTKTIAQNNNS